MTTRLSAPKRLREKVSRFAKDNDMDVKVVEGKPCDICIVQGDGKVESFPDTLYVGGWIKCSTAWEMAKKRRIPLILLGSLLDLLDIRVRQCSLGCFE